jgi:Family of unknown function (DUF5305)
MKAMVVVLALLIGVAAVAGFWWYWAQSTTKDPAPTPAFAFSQVGAYSYVAHLTNNSLYTVNNLTDPGTTLFYEITSSLELSFLYQLTVDRPVDIATTASLTFTLATAAWSKPLGEEAGSAEVAGATGASVVVNYHVNVTGIVALASAIQNETGYQPDSYALLVVPQVTSTVRTSTSEAALDFSPALTLNFTGQKIVPSGLSTTERGTYAPPVVSHPARSFWQVTTWPIGLLVVALVGAGTAGYWVARSSLGGRPRDVEEEARLYEEGIAHTKSLPPTGPRVQVQGWADLIKVADTIGRPILRVDADPAKGTGGAGPLFYVLADATTYVLEVPRSPTSAEPVGGAADRQGRSPTRSKKRRLRPRASIASLAALRAYVPAAVRVWGQVAALEAGSEAQVDSEESLRRSIELARRGRFSRAWVLLDRAAASAGTAPGEEPSLTATSEPWVPSEA